MPTRACKGISNCRDGNGDTGPADIAVLPLPFTDAAIGERLLTWFQSDITMQSADGTAACPGSTPPPPPNQGKHRRTERCRAAVRGPYAAIREKGTHMSAEKKLHAASGWAMLAVVLVAFVVIIAAFIWSIIGLASAEDAGVAASPLYGWGLGISIAAFCLIWIPVCGFFTLQPGQARVCILFGDYKGTVRDEGFRWANPFYSRSMGSDGTAEDATAEVIS